jgi:hypothetical protein
MRPVIGQQREGYAAELLRPDLQARDRVSTDLQNLDVQLLEFFVVRTEPGDLILSATGKREWKERHYRRATPKRAKRDLLIAVGGKREIGRWATWLKHASSPGVRRQSR